jgi:hypothetical protein
VLENVSQESLYNTAASDVVESLLSGFSGTVFAYGQTGSGKTFTCVSESWLAPALHSILISACSVCSMAGDIRNYQHRGVVPRAIHHIFREIDLRVDKLYDVACSYLEACAACCLPASWGVSVTALLLPQIYNEQVGFTAASTCPTTLAWACPCASYGQCVCTLINFPY